jgi:tRNA threonylcarbamoyl adenosine modification protein YjeE
MSSSRQYTLESFPARVVVSSSEAMHALAAALAPLLRPGDTIALEGGLGSGKTTFVHGLARALLGSDPVTSPTFTFWHRYPRADGSPGIEHLDLYRVENERELAELGLEEALGERGIAAVEWPDRAPALVGVPQWVVSIEGSGERPRTVSIRHGDDG